MVHLVPNEMYHMFSCQVLRTCRLQPRHLSSAASGKDNSRPSTVLLYLSAPAFCINFESFPSSSLLPCYPLVLFPPSFHSFLQCLHNLRGKATFLCCRGFPLLKKSYHKENLYFSKLHSLRVFITTKVVFHL